MTTATTHPFAPFESILTLDKPLGPLTTFGVGGRARYYLEPNQADQVALIVRAAAGGGVEIRPLGSGSNLLVAAEVLDGAVICMAKLNRVERHGDTLTAGAGTPMQTLISRALSWGLGGLEGLAGIPGTVGGFVAMNAGGRYGQIADVIRSVTVVRPTGTLAQRTAADLEFAYRHSRLEQDMVVAATLVLSPADPDRLRERQRSILAEKTRTQPYGDKSPGCVFKNPPGESAGQLIDRAGLKGRSIGAAAVSERHANFIVNRGHATARDILALIECVRQEVKHRCKIDLELELKIWK